MTTLGYPIHLVPLPGTALTAMGVQLQPGLIYRVEEADIERERDDRGRSWLDDLSDDAQRRRWGRVVLRVVEVEAARPGRTLVAITATTTAPLQGRGRLVAGERLLIPADLAAELRWLAPAVQLVAHGRVVFDVEPVEVLG